MSTNPVISSKEKLRILVVDDEEEILELFRLVLAPSDDKVDSESKLGNLEEELFGEKDQLFPTSSYDLVYCKQGDEALDEYRKALKEGRPFSVIFLDMRMPPGPDGIWTAENIRKIDDKVNIVIVTAYADIDPIEIATHVPPVDKLLYLQKPLHFQEIRQFASALGAKWKTECELSRMNAELEERVRIRTFALSQANAELENEIEERLRAEEALRASDSDLQAKTQDLVESNIALKVLLKQREDDRHKLEKELSAIEEKMLFNIKDVTFPFLDKLEATNMTEQQREYLGVLKSNLDDILSPILHKITSDKIKLTPSELHIANLIKQGKTTKEIASILNLGVRTIEFHRANIRKKLNITNEGDNLKTVLLSMK